MRKTFTAILLLFTAAAASAMTFYDQLCVFNFNWKKYALQAPAGDARIFSCDREYIQAHLESVLKILRAENTNGLSETQKVSREKMLSLLDGYRLAGKFPMNYYRHERIPVFIDEHGMHCAVGYLLMMTSEEELAQRISRTDNYAWVKDIHDPGVAAWQQASGLSVEDLQLIQGAYDFYRPDALLIAQRFETPQMPQCTTAYFNDKPQTIVTDVSPENVWFKGEGSNGVLNGKWEQRYRKGLPWIEGYYENGLRTGEWKEYYPGTTNLCRTEQWSGDKLNGTRTRWDRNGNVIEEILFIDGEAVSKINYDRSDSVAYIRIPEDSVHVYTQVLNFRGELIACGHEAVYNPGNLQWFQNIELTALNMASVSARSVVLFNYNEVQLAGNGFAGFHSPQLVQYKKEGDWMYYRDTVQQFAAMQSGKTTPVELFRGAYHHYGTTLFGTLMMFEGPGLTAACDSVKVTYADDLVQEFYGYVNNDFVHLHIAYFKPGTERYHAGTYYGLPAGQISETGRYNSAGERTGEWCYFDVNGTMYKSENYAVPRPEIIGMKN